MVTARVLYILLILANILGNISYKIFGSKPIDILFYRHSILLVICLFIMMWNYLQGKLSINSFRLYNRYFVVYNIMRAITTFMAILSDLKQIKQGGLLDTTLIYCSIPLFDLLFYKFYQKEEQNWKYFSLILSGNLLLLVYNIYFYNFVQYIYGYLASMFFSISNIFFLNEKKQWQKTKDHFIILFDMTLFCFVITILTLIFAWQIPHISLLTLIVSLSGTIVTVLVYFLFFISTYNPSFALSNLDLILSLLIDVSVFSVFPSNMTLFITLLMLYILYKRYSTSNNKSLL